MDAKKLYKRVCTTLEADVRRFWGGIRQAEKKSCGVGQISRFYRGSREIMLMPLLQFLCAVGIHPASFFARALGRPLDTEVLLGDMIVEHRSGNRLWRQVEAATAQLELGADTTDGQGRRAVLVDASELVASMAGSTMREQIRRLRNSRRYRHPAFARAYIKHLDALRDDEPDLACRLVARVAIHLIPAIPGPIEERAELQCEALGIFGSAMRLKTDFSTAARALFLALQLAEQHRLSLTRGSLLHRIAHLLEESMHAEMALIPLREALEIYVHSGSAVGLGKTLIVQGRIFCCIRKYEKAIEVLTRSSRWLPEERQEFARYHFCAYQALAEAHQQLGDLKAARMLLAKASTLVREDEQMRQASLIWQKGNLSDADGDAAGAEMLLNASRQGLKKHVNKIQEALVSVDVVRVLLKQGKLQQACNTASSTARFLEPLEGNPTAEAAVLELARAGIEGRLSLEVVHGVRRQLEEARPEARAR